MSDHPFRWTARAARPEPCVVAKLYTSRTSSICLLGHASAGSWLHASVPTTCNELHLPVLTVLPWLDSLPGWPTGLVTTCFACWVNCIRSMRTGCLCRRTSAPAGETLGTLSKSWP